MHMPRVFSLGQWMPTRQKHMNQTLTLKGRVSFKYMIRNDRGLITHFNLRKMGTRVVNSQPLSYLNLQLWMAKQDNAGGTLLRMVGTL